ncbi:hypothetical protein [Thermococcus sp. MV5]|uniref:hypothetical protein n=1 Tax=Thermococcus sp. MV5 TaxID=1638272 RepID=UPI00143ABF4C|nr:hypothetical protein [Thermococcus sp. MV5]
MKAKYWFGWGIIFVTLLALFIAVSNRGSIILGVASLLLGAIIAAAYGGLQ